MAANQNPALAEEMPHTPVIACADSHIEASALTQIVAGFHSGNGPLREHAIAGAGA